MYGSKTRLYTTRITKAISGGSSPAVNPGVSLPEDQAIRLAQYMVARWQGHDVLWILPGDGDYRGEKAEKWKRVGRAIYGHAPHAPVVLHPGGMHWVLAEFNGISDIDTLNEARLGVGNRGDLTGGDPPEYQDRSVQWLEPLLPFTQRRDMRTLVDELLERL